MKNKSIIICSVQRSGSSLFGETLKTQKQFGKPNENLLYYERQEEYLNEFNIHLKGLELEDALKILLKNTSTDNGISSLKLMMSTLEKILYQKNENILKATKTIKAFENSFNNPLYIHFIRKNKIKQIISHAYLRKIKIAHAKTEAEAKNLHILKENTELTIDDLEKEFQYLVSQELKWKNYFIFNHISPKVIYFEEFLKDKRKILQEIAEALNISFEYQQINDEPLLKTSNSKQKELEIELTTYLFNKYDENFLRELGF